MRNPDWENILNKYIHDNRERRFEWGEFDCVLFTFGAVKAITGNDHLTELEWSNEEEAQAILEQKPLADRIADKLEEVPPAFAKRGDVGMYEGACGLVIGRNCLFVGNPWRVIPVTQLERAFSV